MKLQALLPLGLFSLIIYFSFPSCHKQDDNLPPVDNPPVDTIMHVDTLTPVDTPAIKGKTVRIQVTELGTMLPVPNCQVYLYLRFSSPFYPTFDDRIDSLGTTDDQGRLNWHWKGDTLAGNTYFGFGGPAYAWLTEKISVGKIPADEYNGRILAPGVVQLRIEMKKDSLQFDAVEVVQFKTTYNQQFPNWDNRASFTIKAPFDTTITLINAGPATWAHGIRYNLDNSSYNSYLYSPTTKTLDIPFKARDTLYQHVVIE